MNSFNLFGLPEVSQPGEAFASIDSVLAVL
jgi:hypothetical protein